ncbi:unnamed protein product [Darwinula stevensoni]|uniref:Uncharacterized protein n=1 Tax=Darwinula stevensoni TaxID=69355 RepID=A0A7R9A4I7_9CRUS|nr:unnamed protein product [Darwinula stevensoni]CAG0884357.1 unnamed protein product [Darwinula stevensoni]
MGVMMAYSCKLASASAPDPLGPAAPWNASSACNPVPWAPHPIRDNLVDMGAVPPMARAEVLLKMHEVFLEKRSLLLRLPTQHLDEHMNTMLNSVAFLQNNNYDSECEVGLGTCQQCTISRQRHPYRSGRARMASFCWLASASAPYQLAPLAPRNSPPACNPAPQAPHAIRDNLVDMGPQPGTSGTRVEIQGILMERLNGLLREVGHCIPYDVLRFLDTPQSWSHHQDWTVL